MSETKEYVSLFLIWLLSTLIIRAILRKRTSKDHLPPRPLSLPIIGHLHLLAPIPHQALAKLSFRHGPLFHINLGSVPCVVVSSPEISEEFLKLKEIHFSDRLGSSAIDYLTYGSQGFLFAPYGPYWKFMKKICVSQLLGSRTLDFLQPVRQQEIEHFVGILSKKSNVGTSVDIGSELMRLSNNVISRMLMSKRCSEDDNEAGEIRSLVHEIAEVSGRFNLSDYVWFCKNLDPQGIKKRYKVVREMFDEMIEKIIDEHQTARRGRKEETFKDLLDILLDISEDTSSEMKLTRENIKAFVLDIFSAGTDTTAITIEWALSELINHPKILQKAVGEVDRVVGNKRLVKESDIPNLPYLQAIVKETLRLHPSVPLTGRLSSKETTIAGYMIPAKTALFVNNWATGRDPKYWENPLEFRPERFLGNEKGQPLDVKGQHFHFLPFGSGRRGCPGASLAMQIVQTTLGCMIQCFEWKVEGGNVNMEEGHGLTMPKAHPLVCFPVTRLNPIPSM